jgi:hypothetical protein
MTGRDLCHRRRSGNPPAVPAARRPVRPTLGVALEKRLQVQVADRTAREAPELQMHHLTFASGIATGPSWMFFTARAGKTSPLFSFIDQPLFEV